jgi:NAD(P)-dependent dehydrogenase (short-subunit alcohol dehydrogenase family)
MRAPFGVVIITGASSGLGAALARAYAEPRVVLGLLGRDRKRLDAVLRACEGKGATVSAAVMDVTEASGMASWLCEFDRRHAVDLLVANAGTSAGPNPDSPSEGAEAVARQVGVNLLGAINTVEPLLPAMCSRARGRVAVVASIAAYRGLPDSPGYCASKAGLRAYAEALRPRLERHGVGISVICPGFFDSPMTDRFDGPTPFLLSSERAARIVKRGIDRGRRRIAFPWPLVFGLQFCDLAPAVIGDAILRHYRFRIHPAQ